MKKQFPPGPFGNIVAGNLSDLKNRVLDFFCSLQKNFGDIVTIRFAIRKVIYLQHPDYIQHVLQENNRNYTKSLRYEQLKYLLGNGLLTSEGEFWLRQRRMIQPAFHRQKLMLLADEMVHYTDVMLKRWETEYTNQSFNVAGEMMALTLEIVGRTLLNADVRSDAGNVGEAMSYLLKSVNIRTRTPILLPIWIPLPRHLKIKKAISTINKVLDKVIEGKRNDTSGRYDLLSMLMEARYEDTGEPMSNKQLRDEVMTIFMAGHETTANALSWTLYLLSKHPDVLEKCRSEIKSVLGDEKPTFEKLQHLTYLAHVIEESMRLYPPAWIIGRKTVAEDEIGGYKIPAGTNVLISPYALHRDERFWNEPLKFRPERFENEDPRKKFKFAYIPFGGGPRLCIGNNFAMMEMQIVLAMILQKLKPVLDESHPIEQEPLITLRPKFGIKMKFSSHTN